MGRAVEIDETFIEGKREGYEARPGWVHHKNTVLTLVERGGSARSFHIDEATKEELSSPIIRENLDRESPPDDGRSASDTRASAKNLPRTVVVDHSRKEYGYTDARRERRSTRTRSRATIRFSSAA